MVHIVIPYLPSAAQGRELEYAVAGWKRHFREDALIIVVGEGLSALDADGVVYLESKRVEPIPGQYRQHLDYVSCLKKVRRIFPHEDGFIFVGDDCYAVNDFTLADVQVLKMLEPDFHFNPESSNEWRRDKMKTKKVLQEAGLPTRNFTTHLPIWYEWDRLEALWGKYDMLHNSYVVEDLYFNTWHKDNAPFHVNAGPCRYKLGVYQKMSLDILRKESRDKIWVTNSPVGWNFDLDRFLREHYGLNR